MKPERKLKETRLASFGLAMVIFAAGFLAYFNSFSNEFVLDDEYLIVDNPQIKSFGFLPQAFSTGLFQAYGVGKGSFYRPLQTLTYMLDYRFWKFSPLGYHLTNTILHLFSSALLYVVVISLTGDLRPAFIAALLFAVHPLHTQAVTYISGRADLLSTFFMLLSFLCFIRFLAVRDKIPRRIFYVVSFISFVPALLSKEAAFILPLFLVFYIFTFNKDAKFGRFNRIAVSALPFFAVIIIYGILRLTALNFFEGTFLAETPPGLRLLTSCKNIFAYLGLLIAPAGLHIERDVIFVKSLFDIKVMLSLVLLFAIFLWMGRIRKKDPVLFFFSGWFFLGLLPVSNIFPLNATLAEHWVYLASMGVFAMVGLGCARLLDFARKSSLSPLVKLGIISALTAAAVTYGLVTARRNLTWRDPLSLYLDTKRHVPGNYKVRNNLGRVYLNEGLTDKAIEEFEASVKIQPLYAQAHSNLGLAYAKKGLRKKAIMEYERALELNGLLSRTYLNLAAAYLETGDLDKALEVYGKGVKNCPDDPYLHSMFGLALAESGRLEEAIMEGKKSLELGFNDPTLHYNMAIIYEYNREGARYGVGFDFKAAERCYLRTLELNPQDKEARDNLEYLRNNSGGVSR